MVVGGVAVTLLGYIRSTIDLDVLVPATATAEQGTRIRQTLERLGATRSDGSPLPAHLFDGEDHVRALTPSGLVDFIAEGRREKPWACVSAIQRGVVEPDQRRAGSRCRHAEIPAGTARSICRALGVPVPPNSG